jgi:hypothetical protein
MSDNGTLAQAGHRLTLIADKYRPDVHAKDGEGPVGSFRLLAGLAKMQSLFAREAGCGLESFFNGHRVPD